MALATVLLGLASAGCAGGGERAAGAPAAAIGFERALERDDPKAVCVTLAPGTRDELEESERAPCHVGIDAEELSPGGPVRTVDVYGNQARVVLESDTLFLSRFPDGWKVVAAGCEPEPGSPYRCTVKGG
ncbi:hypothetical protein ACFUIZ_33780 [Streptomyces cinereoruber]|uniref:hypothetical protein n=1 Tax=Streptomyces cinereoruber TaxID=67260 RepID=UPI00364452F6